MGDAALARGPEVELMVDGQPLRAFQGESVAAALLAGGKRALRTTSRTGQPRGLYCGIGVCFDCMMTIDRRPNVRACQTPVRPGMRVETQDGDGMWAPSRPFIQSGGPEKIRKVLIELFTQGCPACEGWSAYAHELAASATGYDLRVWDPREERDAVERENRKALYGIKELPAIVVDGKLLACCR